MTSLAALLVQARRLLEISAGELGEMLGSSLRTAQRWETEDGCVPMPEQLAELARAVYPRDSRLAAALAAAAGTSLLLLGLVPAARKAKPAALPPELLVDSIVCVAAEAMDAPPGRVRPILQAAFTRARELGLSAEEVARALEEKASGD